MMTSHNAAGQTGKHIGGRHNERAATGLDDRSIRVADGLVSGGVSQGHVWLNLMSGVGVTVELTPAQAEEVAAQLHAWSKHARDSRP
jgi:hypothetical protein